MQSPCCFLTFSTFEYGGLTIYDDAFKNYLWVKVFDDNVFAIIKSHFFFICLCFNMVSFRGLIQNFQRAFVPPSYAEFPPPPVPTKKSDVNQTCQLSVFSPIGAYIRMWCTAGAVERRAQMFVYRLSPFSFPHLAIFSPFLQTERLFTGCNN